MAQKLKLEAGKYYKTRDGRKVGPMVVWLDSDIEGAHKWHEGPEGGNRFVEGGDIWATDGTSKYGCPTLIAECTEEETGPVRMVTRKEIVEGRFGDVIVNEGSISVAWMTEAHSIRAAIATLTQIADALEDK